MTEHERERKRKNREYEHWHRIGGVVVDVATMLEHLGRMGDNLADAYEAEHIRAVKRTAVLVASHALRSLVGDLNNECTSHYVPSEEDFAASK